jgi:membrane-associated phospholipid phosphatase
VAYRQGELPLDYETPILSENLDSLPDVIPTWDARLAGWVSNVFNPAIISVTTQILAASQLATPIAWRWVIYSIVLSTVAPLMMITYLLKKGKVSDIDIFHRQQRYFPYLFTIFCNVIILATMLLGLAPSLLIYLLIAGILQGLIMFGINMRWKISAHSAGIANFSVFLLFLFGSFALPVIFLIPMMIWARVRLKRHTFLQTLAGASMGILVLGLFLIYFSIHNPKMVP